MSVLARIAVACSLALVLVAGASFAQQQAGTVCNVKVVSDKVLDVSSLEAWKASFIDDKASNQDKGIAIWRSVITYQYQDAPPAEYLQHEDLVYDPIKMFNVYGYAMCSPHSSHMEALARYVGFQARGWAITHHSVNEFFYDGGWHHFDSSLMCYYLKKDGTVAGIQDIFASVKEFYDAHPDIAKADPKNKDKMIRAFEMADGRTGWKKGPELMASSPQLNSKGWWPAGTHGWYASMQAFDGNSAPGKPAYLYEYLASMGYRVNIQLRPGEKLVRNWSNKGLQVNMDGAGNTPGCLEDKEGFLKNAQAFCDKLDPKHPNLTNGRVGNGTLSYEPPPGSLKTNALVFDNLEAAASNAPGGKAILGLKDPAKPGRLEIRMPTSYVYLGGEMTFDATVGDGSSIAVSFSDNNGLDWKDVAKIEKAGPQTIDLKKLVFRRYDYRLRFDLQPKSAIAGLKISHDIQCSQRALPALDAGENAITFSAGPQESTVTVEANNGADHKGRQTTCKDFHVALDSMKDNLAVNGKQGSVTVPISTPGDMTTLRMCACYRTWGPTESWEMQVSWDDGKTFKKVGDGPAQDRGRQAYIVVKDVPKGARKAMVRFLGHATAGNMLMSFRVDADYASPTFGFRPVKVTYVWEENGQEKTSVHVARQAADAYKIKCEAKPTMKSISLELAEQ